MRAFILCTGRTGSKSFVNACKHFNNYTVGHETRTKLLGSARFDYPENHIEADNRLSWFLGTLDQKFGKDPLYVHLTRDKESVTASFNNRWEYQGNILKSFSEGILLQGYKKHSELERKQIIHDYLDMVNNNIKAFLKDKPNKLNISLDTINDDFPLFCQMIEAEGDLDKALDSFSTPINTSQQSKTGLVDWVKNKLK